MVKSIIYDCDPGVDDALAIVLAHQLGADLRGITTVAGNGTIDQTTLNARRVFEDYFLALFHNILKKLI